MKMVNNSRRNFIKSASFAVAGSVVINSCNAAKGYRMTNYSELDETAAMPVINTEFFPDPVIIESLDLLRYKDNFICRVRSADGVTGISVGNNDQLKSLYPVFIYRLKDFFIGKDVRYLEDLLDGVYVHKSNYKLQGLGLWVPLATIEFAILDMLGRISGKSIGELLGSIHNRQIAVYQANNFRGRTAEDSVMLIKEHVESTGAKALKFKVGGRMSNNEDYPPGRTEKLIPLIRKTFGDDMIVYADSNGSYTSDEAIRIGKLMEEYRFDFYEEPVPFDWYEETKLVAESLSIPVAGGEQEPSMHNFRWMIANNALDIVQPDMFYFGGMIRSMKVARMAAICNKPCVPHISGSGLGYLYMMHFVSALPNAGPFHEFKGFNNDIPLECPTSSLTSDDGVVTVPSGAGTGVEIDPDFIKKHKVIAG